VAVLARPSPAPAAEGCHYDDIALELVCGDGGTGGGGSGGGGGGSSTDYWTGWYLAGACGGGGPVGDGLVDITTPLVLAVRRHIVDGEVVEVDTTCIDLDDAAGAAWAAVAAAIQALPDPRWEASPDGVVAPGLTGLDTWLWYGGSTQVGPIDATWVEPVTGLGFGVRGRGWTETITWDLSEATYRVTAPRWDQAAGVGGSPERPAATHVYDTTSRAAGHPAGYPVELELYWVGEYQVLVPSGAWTAWAPIPSTLTETTPATYPVVQVRSKLAR